MSEQKKREDYDSDYLYRADNLWKEVSSPDDLKYPKVISFYVKSGTTPVKGIAKIKEVDYPVEMNTMKAFEAIQNLMMTKKLTKGRRTTLKATMSDLQEWQVYLIGALLNHLRDAYTNNEKTVWLSYKEYYLLKQGGFKKRGK